MRNLLIAFCLVFGTANAIAQQVDWNMAEAQTVESPLQNLPAQDQQGILHRLGGEASDLVAMRVDIGGGHIFLVQGVYPIGGICGANNCEFWILSSDYRILLDKVVQMFKLQPSVHDGLPDIITTMHGSAFDSSLSYWRMQGGRYVRVSCADSTYRDADGSTLKSPRISLRRCGTGG